MNLIETYAPQMAEYKKQFHTDGDVDWQPYLMYFHPRNYRSAVVNTDALGFRFSRRGDGSFSVADNSALPSARLLAGNSVAFGIGATSDDSTIPSRMMAHDTRPEPWLNFGGRAFNSAQELVLVTLYRHLLPRIEEIVLFSGANNLFLARMAESYIQQHGAFYNCGRFHEIVDEAKGLDAPSRFSLASLFGRSRKAAHPADNAWSMDQRIAFAADLTLRHLDGWNAVAKDIGAKLTYFLQPTSGWVRDKGCRQEEALFAELARLPRYTTVHKDVLQRSVCEQYASLLEAGARRRGISFVDVSAALRAAVSDDQWLFIDHTHLTDKGHDLVAQLVVDSIK